MAYVSSDFPSIQLLSKFVWSYVQKGQITYTVFFLSSPNKQTLVVIKYLVIKIISSTLSLLWQEKSVENNAKQFQLSWRKVVYATIWGQFLRHCGKRDLESRLRKT